MNLTYKADRPMQADRITLNTLVYVPIWRSGTIVRWHYGHVVEVRTGEETGYLVCLMSEQPDNGKKQLYWIYSMACGMCHDRNPEECFQCNPINEISHAKCDADFTQNWTPTH
jgi:hypothetical protein